MDHEHFRLKLLYKQKKEVTNDLKKSKAEVKALQVLKIVYINAYRKKYLNEEENKFNCRNGK